MAKVVVVGGSGFLGSEVRRRLVARGDEVAVIGRGPGAEHHGWSQVSWDARSRGNWIDALDGSSVVVHMSGKRVDARPTASNIEELISSRAGAVRLVGDAVAEMAQPPRAWVQLSSLAIFGDAGDEIIDEGTTPPLTGHRQMVGVCRAWEQAYHDTTASIERRVLLRPAIAIGGAGDPATAQLARLARWGLGGRIGSGRQWVSWIAATDLFDLLLRAVDDAEMSGLYHLTAPNPVSNAEMMRSYREAVGRGFGLPSPALATKIGALALGSDPALALTGRRCVPTRLLSEGYDFAVDDIADAVRGAVESM